MSDNIHKYHCSYVEDRLLLLFVTAVAPNNIITIKNACGKYFTFNLLIKALKVWDMSSSLLVADHAINVN